MNIDSSYEEIDGSSLINDEALVVYSFYVESNNTGVANLTPSIVNFINIDQAEDLVSTGAAVPQIIDLGAGFYKFSYQWDQTNSPRAFLIKIETGLEAAPERFITMRIERSDYLPSLIKRIVDIEQGSWELDSNTNELIIRHAVTENIIGQWQLFDQSGITGTTRNPFYRKAKTVSPY